MNIDKKARMALLILIGGVVLASLISLIDLRKPDPNGQVLWSGYDETRPWFPNTKWDWGLDMFNQKAVKPQSEGTFQEFPEDSIPRKGVEAPVAEGNRETSPKNPTQANQMAASVKRGEALFNTYCGACHGNDGKGMDNEAGNPVAMKIAAPNIADMVSGLTESHIYNKIRYGGPVMPAYAIQTSQQDRWDIVNYAKKTFKGK